jgi:Gpi18-like mannosyltransferase
MFAVSNALKETLRAFFLWRFFLLTVILVSSAFISLNTAYLAVDPSEYEKNHLFWAHANFDGNHYINISQSGYGFAEEAFFPLYPTLMQKLSEISGYHVSLTGLFISNVSFFLSLIFLYKLMKLDYSDQLAKLTILLLLIFPASFYFSAIYSESLFFMLVILTFYSARTNKWWLAGITGALVTYCRFVGIFIFPALLAEILIQSRDKKGKLPIRAMLLKSIPLVLVPFGLVYFMMYLQETTGDPLAFFHVQKYYGQFRSEKIILLYQVLWRYLKMLLTVEIRNPIYMNIVLESVVGILFGVTSIVSLRKVRFSYSIFNLLAYLVPTFTGSFVSLPRYVLVCFPSFIVLAQLLEKRPTLLKLFGTISILALYVFWARFSQGMWVG